MEFHKIQSLPGGRPEQSQSERNTHKPSGMQLFSSLDLFVVAVTLMRSLRGLYSSDSSV